MTHKEEQLLIASKIPIEDNFQIPDGLMIPCGQQVLIKRIGQEAFISRGGIIIPETSSKKRGIHGIVMAIGPLVDLTSYPVKVGLKVEFRDGLEEDTLHNGIAYLLVDQFNIKGIVPKGNFKHPKYPTTEEKRREERIEVTKRIHKETENGIDKINNG